MDEHCIRCYPDTNPTAHMVCYPWMSGSWKLKIKIHSKRLRGRLHLKCLNPERDVSGSASRLHEHDGLGH